MTSTYSRGHVRSISKFACGFRAGWQQVKANRRAHHNHEDQVWRGGSLGLRRAGTNLTGRASHELLVRFVV